MGLQSDMIERLNSNSNMTVSEKEAWAHSSFVSQMLLKWSMRETPTSLSHASSLPMMMAVCSRVLAELCMRHPRAQAMFPLASEAVCRRTGLAELWETLGWSHFWHQT